MLGSGGRYQISSDGRLLTVQGVTEAQDEGMFTCHASNIVGNDSATITLSVQGTYVLLESNPLCTYCIFYW